jgi:hypothetical protein
MQQIEINGIFTYIDNIKTLKLDDQIKLLPNPNNKMSKDAIGAYTLTGKKIGYVPFTTSQIDINGKYIVSKIKLNQISPAVTISIEFNTCNFIHCEPLCISQLKLSQLSNDKLPNDLVNDLKQFGKYLEKSGNKVNRISVYEYNESFITLCISTHTTNNIFYTVTKQYYDKNIFKYNEFYKFGLTNKCIYQPFQIHRLEKYLEYNYKSIKKCILTNKITFNKIKNTISKITNILLKNNYGFEQIESTDLILLNKSTLTAIINPPYTEDFIKLLVQYLLGNIQQDNTLQELYNPNNLLKLLNKNEIKLDDFNIQYLLNMFINLKIGGICYNHKYKLYCTIDLYDDNNIIEIANINEISELYLIELLIKLIISEKQIINIYNPITGILFYLDISTQIKDSIINDYFI